jgi:hypothetical protein
MEQVINQYKNQECDLYTALFGSKDGDIKGLYELNKKRN